MIISNQTVRTDGIPAHALTRARSRHSGKKNEPSCCIHIDSASQMKMKIIRMANAFCGPDVRHNDVFGAHLSHPVNFVQSINIIEFSLELCSYRCQTASVPRHRVSSLASFLPFFSCFVPITVCVCVCEFVRFFPSFGRSLTQNLLRKIK